jgi:D-3-phosphoglycerate dehydrogenase / 2-oxoglutarate reductase
VRVAVLDDYQLAVPELSCFELLAGHDVSVHCGVAGDLDGLTDVEALVLIRERTPVTTELLDRTPALRLIAQTGGGIQHIDVDACTARGVLVCAGGGSSVATAELTFGLVLAALRHLPEEAAGLRSGGWQTTLGTELHGTTLGIWGYGRIGALVARYGAAFGMHVLAWGREGSRERAATDGITFAASELDLVEEADVLSLHLRLTEETRGTVTATHFARMKPTALFVNTARAGLVERGALAAALASGRPGAAAVDVFDEEPVPAGEEPLLDLPQALCTPHLGYVTRESYELYFARAFEAVNGFVAGTPVDVVNPQVLSA